MRLKMKFQRSVSVIKEETADEVESEKTDSDQDPKEQEPPLQQQEVINTESKDDSESYIIIPQEEPIESRQLELDLLSNIDPEDEFLQSQKSYSLIESISSSHSSFSVLQSQHSSEYTLVSGSSLHSAVVSLNSF